MKGSRVQNVVNELQGEKIDIVKWSEDLDTFARAALAPAEIGNIMIDHDEKQLDVVVEDDQLSLAIGRRGQNVRLAAMLSGYKVSIISKLKLQEKIEKSVSSLVQIEGMTEARAQVLVQGGVTAIGDLTVMPSSELSTLLGCEEDEAQTIIDNTLKAIEDGTINLQGEEEEELVSASATPQYVGVLERESEQGSDDPDKFSDAERRLREELAAFKLK